MIQTWKEVCYTSFLFSPEVANKPYREGTVVAGRSGPNRGVPYARGNRVETWEIGTICTSTKSRLGVYCMDRDGVNIMAYMSLYKECRKFTEESVATHWGSKLEQESYDFQMQGLALDLLRSICLLIDLQPGYFLEQRY